MPGSPLAGPEKLARHHELDAFSCSVESLDNWLKRFARINQQSDLTTTCVAPRKQRAVGYYSLTAGSVNREDATARVAKGMPNHPIGVVLLARLAVDRSEQGTGLGHALSEDARRFYMHFDFEPSPVHPFHLMLLMKDIRASGRQH